MNATNSITRATQNFKVLLDTYTYKVELPSLGNHPYKLWWLPPLIIMK